MSSYTIHVGSSRHAMSWKPKQVTWEGLKKTFSTPRMLDVTMAEYEAMSKDDKIKLKDIGGYVGGTLENGTRSRETVVTRSMLVLDIDHATEDTVADVNIFCSLTAPCQTIVHSTLSSTKKEPRYRVIMPFSREAQVDEYVAIAEFVIGHIGAEAVDKNAANAAQLMFWPACLKDAEYEFIAFDGPALDIDWVLGHCGDWRDLSKKLGPAAPLSDPRDKDGLIGAFCRTYGIREAVTKFLPDKYIDGVNGRLTYTGGSTTSGAIIYDDNLHLYSHHESDPAAIGHCQNAFDLVRIHLFGREDRGKEYEDPTRAPSYAAMIAMCRKDEAVMRNIVGEDLPFDDVEEEEDPDAWKTQLDLDKNGKIDRTRKNLVLIMTKSKTLKGTIAKNEHSDRVVVIRDLPWHKVRDKEAGDTWDGDDEVKILRFMEKYNKRFPKDMVNDSVVDAAGFQKIHPIKDYLNSLVWDGVERVDTLLIDRLGADDTPYTRAVTRKMLAAAVARQMTPGCKFDYMVILVGKQGIGKSSILRDLGREKWFTDNVYGIGDGKNAMELIQGFWIVEMSELASMKKNEMEDVKAFITTQADTYRAAYAKTVKDRPRQCVFVGTTNAPAFLRDTTGNRRFWPVAVHKKYEKLTEDEVAQVWAEAYVIWKNGEKLYLDDSLEAVAQVEQKAYEMDDPFLPLVSEYLDKPLPAPLNTEWYPLSDEDKKIWLQKDFDQLEPRPLEYRKRVSIAEVWIECLGGTKAGLNNVSNRLHDTLAHVHGWEKMKGKQRVWSKGFGTTCYERKIEKEPPKVEPKIEPEEPENKELPF